MIKKMIILSCICLILSGCKYDSRDFEVYIQEIGKENKMLQEENIELESKITSLEKEIDSLVDKYNAEVKKVEALNEDIIKNEAMIKDSGSDLYQKYYENHFSSNFTSEESRKLISDSSEVVINLIANKDYSELVNYIHPAKGVRFTQYSYVDIDSDLILTKEEFEQEVYTDKIYLWGYYDGIGTDIELTIEEYFDEFVYDADFLNADAIGYNEYTNETGMVENQYAIYHNSIIVEYYIAGINPDYNGMDWRSVRIVFEEYNGEWLIVGLIHNQWTI